MNDKDYKAASFILIRHGLSKHNIRSLIAKTNYGVGTKEYKKIDWDFSGFDPELHKIGIA